MGARGPRGVPREQLLRPGTVFVVQAPNCSQEGIPLVSNIYRTVLCTVLYNSGLEKIGTLFIHLSCTSSNFGGFGTFFSHFAYLLGPSFRLQSQWPSRTEVAGEEPGPLEEKYHGFLAEVYRNLTRGGGGHQGEETEDEDPVSLLDVPALLGAMVPEREFLTQSFREYSWAAQSAYSTAKSTVSQPPSYFIITNGTSIYLFILRTTRCARGRTCSSTARTGTASSSEARGDTPARPTAMRAVPAAATGEAGSERTWRPP